MYKQFTYFWLAFAILVVQIFLLDNISIAMWLRPMIFPLVVLLLPMEWRMVWTLLSALAIGLTMDLALGGSGLYTSSLLPLAVLRPWIMYLTTGRTVEHGDQSALLSRMLTKQVMLYVAGAILVHHTLFFMLETLSFASPMRLVATILCSTLLTMVVSAPIIQLYKSKIA
ncbi:MAG: hypothetical protein J6R90_02805 [Alistipes sp.]|nr:hypothetical protein [Alistipes sp.]